MKTCAQVPSGQTLQTNFKCYAWFDFTSLYSLKLCLFTRLMQNARYKIAIKKRTFSIFNLVATTTNNGYTPCILPYFGKEVLFAIVFIYMTTVSYVGDLRTNPLVSGSFLLLSVNPLIRFITYCGAKQCHTFFTGNS